MNIGILVIDTQSSVSALPMSVTEAVRFLELRGHSVRCISMIAVDASIDKAIECAKETADAVFITGRLSVFRKFMSEKYNLSDKLSCFEIEDTVYLLDEKPSAEFLTQTAVPALNSKSKTFYNSVVLKTFGITKRKLEMKLESCFRNKNRISVKVIECGHGECEVRICFSKKTNDTDGFIKRVADIAENYLFSLSGESLPEAVAGMLKRLGKTVATAESFTGGGIASALVSIPGASGIFSEGIVAYGNAAKIARLGVKEELIKTAGAVSVDTAYEMAANLLMTSGCDYSVATTGNAGPAAEKEGQAGLFYIAVGSRDGIHVFKEQVKSDRDGVTNFGINSALFRLYRYMLDPKTVSKE